MSGVNQQVIASRLNISRTTVSRCFTNHQGINPKTRSKVFSLAAKLGYQYLQSRSPSVNNAKINPAIGVLICSDVEEFHRADYESPGVELLPGVAEFAQLHNWHTDVHFVSPDAETISAASFNIPQLKKRLWRGLILMYPFPPKVIAELTARFLCVSLVEQYGRASVDCVDVNHYRGISLLMERLLQAGHKRIGFFSRRYIVEAVWSNRRFSAYMENLTRNGLRYRENDIIYLDTSSLATMKEGYDRVAAQMRDGVTAWICAADHQAYDLIIALKQRGLDVPRDVSVTGFDGILRPEGAPALETVRIPYHEIGFVGSRRLFDKLNKRLDAPQEILLDCRLQEGETIGSPAHSTVSVH